MREALTNPAVHSDGGFAVGSSWRGPPFSASDHTGLLEESLTCLAMRETKLTDRRKEDT